LQDLAQKNGTSPFPNLDGEFLQMNLETVPLSSISPDPANTRKHSRRNLDAIKASLRRFGQQKPIVVDAKGVVLAGNGTLAAATELGWPEIQIVRTELAGVDATAFGIADNRSAELAEWDSTLAEVLASLKAEDFPLEEIGFSADDLAELAGEPEPSDADAEPQIDKAEELRVKWGVELGQLWELGDHRLLCGNSTKKEDVDRVMSGERAAFCFTDPPYGVSYSGRGKSTSQQTIENDDLDPAKLQHFLTECFKVMPLEAGSNVFVCHADQKKGIRPAFESAMSSAGLRMLGTVIWVKNQASMGWQDFRAQHEPILFGCTDGANRMRVEDRTATTVWQIGRDAAAGYLHPTTKPVELVAKAIRFCCPVAATVYEPFSGSGTTIIACEQLGRKCRAIEISPAYVAVAIQRWADATGKEPRKL